MAEAAAPTAPANLLPAPDAKGAKPRKRGPMRLVLLAGVPLLALGAGAGAAYTMVPSVREMVKSLTGGSPAAPAPDKPSFLELPEMTVTMPNNGRPRQLRIRIALELARTPDKANAGDLVGPRVYDSLVLYLRTLRDADVDGALAIDRLRGDIHRRLDLLLGAGVLRDVLITSLIIG